MFKSVGSLFRQATSRSGRRIRGLGGKAASSGFRALTFERLEDRTVLSALAPTVHTAAKAAASAALPPSTFLSVPNRVDMVADSLRDILYVSTTTGDVLRYDWGHQTWLSPIHLGGSLMGMDISPDQNTLFVADGAYSSTNNWIDVVNLITGATRQIDFNRAIGEGGTYSVAFTYSFPPPHDGAVAGTDAVLVSSNTLGSGSYHPVRRVDLATGASTTVESVSGDAMLCADAGRDLVDIADSNGGVQCYLAPVGGIIGLVAGGSVGEIATNGAQCAVPTPGLMGIYDQLGRPQAFVGDGSSAPVGAVYSPTSDVVYFSWRDSTNAHVAVDAYDTKKFTEIGVIDASPPFNGTVQPGYANGRLKVSHDGTLLVCAVDGGVKIYNLLPSGVDLAVSQTASTTAVMAGSSTANVVYHFTVANNGPDAASNVVLNSSVNLEPGVSVDSVQCSGSANFSGTNGSGSWNVGSLAVGASQTLTLTLTVGAGAAPGADPIGATVWASSLDQVLINKNDFAASVATTIAAHSGVSLAPDQTTLFVGGTSGNDTITVNPATAGGNVSVTLNGTTYGPYTVTDHIEVYGWQGNDVITVSPKVTLPAYLFAGSGNDILTGGGGNNVLVGGGGTDVLSGGLGRNLLISGSGPTRMFAGLPGVASSTNAGSILIAGTTIYDNNVAALNAIMQVWTSTASYSQRIASLRTGAASSGYKLDATTIKASTAVDQLFASLGSDWFWDLSRKSLLSGLRPGIQVN